MFKFSGVEFHYVLSFLHASACDRCCVSVHMFFFLIHVSIFSVFNETVSSKIVVWGGAEPTGEVCYQMKDAKRQKPRTRVLMHVSHTYGVAFPPHSHYANLANFSQPHHEFFRMPHKWAAVSCSLIIHSPSDFNFNLIL